MQDRKSSPFISAKIQKLNNVNSSAEKGCVQAKSYKRFAYKIVSVVICTPSLKLTGFRNTEIH